MTGGNQTQELQSGFGTGSRTRLDIQALRAVAVLAVVCNHLWEWPTGGFVGVDVFFVVSGFLITGLLLREHDRASKISFADFYRRRARRILPAATLVIVATVAATYLISSSARGDVVRTDGWWALLFAANWRFASVGTDYFRANETISPLQHYWSLGVEEQFYVVWPIIIVICLALAGRRVLLGVLALLVTSSFAYSLWHTEQSPTWAYFSTLDRAWELGVGALLALVTSQRSWAVPSWLRVSLAWVGLTAIGAAVVTVPETPGFPAPWAALPVLGTALVIAAGTGERHTSGLWPLTSRPIQYVGDISYSLYLWHFPVIVLTAVFLPEGGWRYSLISLMLMVSLSSLCYHLVERPVLRSNWLEPRQRRHRGDGFWTRAEQRIAVAGLAALVVALSLGALQRTSSLEASPEFLVTDVDDVDDQMTPEEVRSAAIVRALQTSTFPELDPSLDELGIEKWFEDLEDIYCVEVLPEAVGSCVFGPSTDDTAVVIGDSYAMAWMPGVATALTSAGYQVHQITRGECPVWDVPVSRAAEADFAACEDYRDWWIDYINNEDYDLVVAATASSTVARLQSGNEGESAAEEITVGLQRSLEQLRAPGRALVVLAAPPKTPDLAECVTNVGGPDDCAAPISYEWELVTEAEAEAVAQVPGARYIDTSSLFCAFGRCPGYVGDVPLRVDGSHLSIEASEDLAPLLERALLDRAGKRSSRG